MALTSDSHLADLRQDGGQDPANTGHSAIWKKKNKSKESKKIKHLTVKPIRYQQDAPRTNLKKTIKPKFTGDTVTSLETQVAGHGTGDKLSHRGMLIHQDGFVLKPAQAPPKGENEIEFYENICSSHHPTDIKLYSLTPKYYGTEMLASDGVALSQYLILEDLTQGMQRPCVMDVKIGAKTYGPDASTAKMKTEDAKYLGTKKPFGFSVLGILNRSGKDGSLRRYDKSFGMELGTDSVKKILQVFFNTTDNSTHCQQNMMRLLEHFRHLLVEIRDFFELQTRYHIYASSLLFVYDHSVLEDRCAHAQDTPECPHHSEQLNRLARLKIIDFAHVYPGNGDVDTNFLFGINNLCKLFAEFKP